MCVLEVVIQIGRVVCGWWWWVAGSASLSSPRFLAFFLLVAISVQKVIFVRGDVALKGRKGKR